MKYLSIQFINQATGRLPRASINNINLGLPNIAGLDLICLYESGKMLATCPVESVLPNTKAVQEITEGKFTEIASSTFANLQLQNMKDAYDICQEKINDITDWYHPIEISESVLRDDTGQIQAAIDASDETDARAAAPLLIIESDVRGITVQALANLIKDKRDAFRNAKDVLTGTRGKIVDEIQTIAFDINNIKESFKSLNVIDSDLWKDL